MNNVSRPITLGKYILDHKTTIRQTATYFNLSKSTVHIDVSKKLATIDFDLYTQVKKILDNNFLEKNIRGGQATKQKYLMLKEKNN